MSDFSLSSSIRPHRCPSFTTTAGLCGICGRDPNAAIEPRRTLDRDLLRRAGEHLGALAEQTHEQLAWCFRDVRKRRLLAERYGRLSRLSRDMLEIANG